MTRLVNDTRDEIVNAVITHRFNSDVAAIMKEHAAAAYDVYRDVFTRKERDLMASLPDGWLPVDDDIHVQAGDLSHRFAFSGKFSASYNSNNYALAQMCTATTVYERFPHTKKGQCLKVYEARDKMGERLTDLLRRAVTLSDAIADARKQLTATIYTFYTVEKLIEAWPEVAPFVPTKVKPKPQLPALPTAALNDMFRLPA